MIQKTIITLVLLAAFNIIVAVPFTTSGFMKVPDAYVLSKDMAELSINGYLLNPNWEKNPTVPDKYLFCSSYKLEYGIMNWCEIGMIYTMLPYVNILSPTRRITKDIYYVNAKLNITDNENWKNGILGNILKSEDLKSFIYPTAISVGIENLFSEANIHSSYLDLFYVDSLRENSSIDYDMDDYRKNSIYISTSTPFKIANIEFDLTVGWGTGRFRPTSQKKDAFMGIFAALTTKISDKFAITLEEDGYSINAGVQYNFGAINTRLGIYRLDEMVNSNPNPRISFSLQHPFNLNSSLKRGGNWIAGLFQKFPEKGNLGRETKARTKAKEIISTAKANLESKNFADAISILEKNVDDYTEYTDIHSEMTDLLTEAKEGMEMTSLVDEIGKIREKRPAEEEKREITSLEEELKKIRERRKKAEKDLEELRKLLEE